MKSLASLLLLASLGSAVTAAPEYPVRADPIQLIRDESAFRPFAKAVEADVARLLREPGLEADPGRLKMLLAIEVHFSIHYGHEATALGAARRIRDLQTDPAERAFAGVTTEAIVAAQRKTGQRPGSNPFGAVFSRELSARLTALPMTAAMRAVLVAERDADAAITPEAILRELVEKLGAAPQKRGTYTLEDANEIIRARHKLADIVPIKPQLLAALDAAIAVRPIAR